MVDPATIASGIKTASVAARGVNAAMETAGRIHKILDSEAKIASQELTLDCRAATATYSVVVGVKSGLGRWVSRNIKFPYPNIQRIEVRALPMFTLETAALYKTGDGWEVATSALSSSDTFLIRIEYTVDGDNFLDALVHRSRARDPRITEESEEYWIAAQFRHPEVLRNQYGRIDLRDIDFQVDVAVHQALKTAVPQMFVRELEIIGNMIRERQRDRKVKLAMDHLRTRNLGATGKEAEILADIQALFTAPKFRDFVDVRDEFRYSESYRGAKAYTQIPFASLPEHMTVVSRTDLSLDKPAANGRVLYQKAAFEKKIEEYFPETMKRLSEPER